MTTYFEDTPLTMNSADAEMGYGGRPMLNQRARDRKGDASLILSIISFITCFFCGLDVFSPSIICHILAMLFASKSRVSVMKKDYYDSKLMLHWSYICTFAGCFLGGMCFLGVFILSMVAVGIYVNAKNVIYRYNYYE